MATTPTTNYSWGKPTVDGSSGVWGEELNAALDDIDADLATAEATADAALPKAGGTVTGDVHFDSGARATQARTAVTTSIDWSAGNFFYRSTQLTGGLTIGFTNLPSSGTIQFIAYEVNVGSGGSITWTDVDDWADGAPPTPATTGKALFVFWCHDGATVNGMLVADGIA